MFRSQPTIWCICYLLVAATVIGCGGGGASNTELQALAKQYQSARKQVDPERRARNLITVARKQQRVSDERGFELSVTDAMRAASELSDGAASCSIYARLAVLLKQGGQLEAAKKAMEKSQEAADKIESVDGLLSATEDMAKALQLAFDDRSGANQTMAEAAERAAQIPEAASRVLYLCELARKLHEKPWSNHSAALSALQQALDESDSLGGARAANGRIRVAEVQRQFNAEEKAVATLTEARGFAERETDPQERVYALVSIAQALDGLNQSQIAQRVLQAAEDSVAAIQNKRQQQDAARHVDAVKQGRS